MNIDCNIVDSPGIVVETVVLASSLRGQDAHSTETFILLITQNPEEPYCLDVRLLEGVADRIPA